MCKIKKARLAVGFTQAEMSEKLGIPKRTIEEWDRGKTNPPQYVERLVIEELMRVAKKQNTPPRDESLVTVEVYLPKHLADAADEAGLDLSEILQKELKRQLGIAK